MRTFKLNLALDMKAVVPEQFVKDMRKQAQDPESSPFLKNAQEMFPNDDDEFILHILKHGVRRHTREALADLFAGSGLGCTLSPATARVIDRSPPAEDVKPVLATEIDQALQVQG